MLRDPSGPPAGPSDEETRLSVRSVARRQVSGQLTRRDSELPQLSNRPVAERTLRRRRLALGVLLVASFIAVARIAASVWVGIVFGALMAFTTQPVYRKLALSLGERRRWAALLTTVLTFIVVTVGGACLLYVLTRELFGVIEWVQAKANAGSLSTVIGPRNVKFLQRLGVNEADVMLRIQTELGRAAVYATQAAGLVLQTTATAVLSLIIGCITMYYVLLEWPAIPLRLERVLPLDPQHTRALVLEFRDVGRTALVGTMATAIIQGVLATIGYTISDLPHSVTWGLLTAVASFFPMTGTALVWLPVSLHYLADGQIAHAIVQALWGLLVVVGFGDYLLRLFLIGGNGKAQPLLTLVAALGGMEVFGLAGLIVGPVLMSLFVAILRIYEREMEQGERADTQPLLSLEPRDPLDTPVDPPD